MTLVSLLYIYLLGVGTCVLTLFASFGENEFVSNWTMVLFFAHFTQLLFFLKVGQERKNPFIIILVFYFTTFFLTRVGTALVFPVSDTLSRGEYFHDSYFQSLSFMFFANGFFFYGLNFFDRSKDINCFKSASLSNSLAAILFLLILTTIVNFCFPIMGLSSLKGYIETLFLDSGAIKTIAGTLFFVAFLRHRKSITLLLALIVFILFDVLHLLSGSRAVVLNSLFFLIIASLATNIYIIKKISIKFLFFIPLFFFLAFSSFFLATSIRNNIGDHKRSSVINSFSFLTNNFSRTDNSFVKTSKIEEVSSKIFSRVAFLDFSTEIMLNSSKYREQINISTYFKSVVDNLLSPGFDLYDQPRVANSFRFIYDDRGRPSKAAVEKDYHSDQMTIYGELYLLFGPYYSLVILFLLGLIFNLFLGVSSLGGDVLVYVKRCILLDLFITTVGSFGLDWLFIKAFSYVGLYLFFVFLLDLIKHLRTRYPRREYC